MFQLCQKSTLIKHRMDASFSNDFSLVHFLHGIQLIIFLHHNTPHLAKPTLSNHILELKMTSMHLNLLIFIKYRPLVSLLKHNLVFSFWPDIAFSCQFWQINFETIFIVFFKGLFTECRIASLMLFLVIGQFFLFWFYVRWAISSTRCRLLLNTQFPKLLIAYLECADVMISLFITYGFEFLARYELSMTDLLTIVVGILIGIVQLTFLTLVCCVDFLD